MKELEINKEYSKALKYLTNEFKENETYILTFKDYNNTFIIVNPYYFLFITRYNLPKIKGIVKEIKEDRIIYEGIEDIPDKIYKVLEEEDKEKEFIEYEIYEHELEGLILNFYKKVIKNEYIEFFKKYIKTVNKGKNNKIRIVLVKDSDYIYIKFLDVILLTIPLKDLNKEEYKERLSYKGKIYS